MSESYDRGYDQDPDLGAAAPHEERVARAAQRLGFLYTVYGLRDDPPESFVRVFYWLAREAGILCNGRWMQKRRAWVFYRRSGVLPKTTVIAEVAATLGLSETAVRKAIKWLMANQWLTVTNLGRYEPRYTVLKHRFYDHASRALACASRFKLELVNCRDPRLTATDCLNLGKLSKSEGAPGAKFKHTCQSLAWDTCRHIETVRRSVRKLGRFAMVRTFVAPGRRRYLFLSLPHQVQNRVRAVLKQNETLIPARKVMRELLETVTVLGRPPTFEDETVGEYSERVYGFDPYKKDRRL